MKMKQVALIAVAALALGFGMSASAFQTRAVGCVACHNSCDTSFDRCLASGNAYFTCLARSTSCHRGCGCPIP
jgi:hypothetical protein